MSDLPRGTVTFLFTDIEGSTRLWEQEPALMRVALEQHDRLVRHAIERNGGTIFKALGDAFCAAFPTASTALAAALEAQLALRQAVWQEPVRIKARMALHTGAAEPREGDYFGQPLNRVARLLSAGHGEQTLLSLAAEELARDHLPPDATLQPLGEHRLRDLARPEQVFQLLHPDLPDAFPPLRSLDNPALPNNLPPQITSFIGRETEIADIKTLLTKNRLLTLLGPGGSGKTRLTLQVAADVLEAYPDGVWLVELAPLSDPTLVPQAVASVLNIKEQNGKTSLQTLREALQSKRLLILLDNCEHLLLACAQLADALLHASPDIKLLASSREALGIAGEQTYRVPTLSLPDPTQSVSIEQISQYEAVRLFIERATAIKADFTVTNQNAPALASVCLRLDGIPLAIELAAARVRALSLEEINTRLDNRFRLLTGGSRTAMPRQQTLRALIDWSYDLLTDAERTLFRRMAVFAGGWTLEAVEQVGAGESTSGEVSLEAWEVLDVLTSLIDKSLVIAETGQDTGRYHLLETMREYAWEKLRESGETDAVRERHRDCFLTLVEEAEPQLMGASQQTWLDRLESEIDNIRFAFEGCITLAGWEAAGLRMAGAFGRFWYMRGHVGEGQSLLRRILARAESVPDAVLDGVKAKALQVAGMLWTLAGDYTAGRDFCLQCLELLRREGDPLRIAGVLNNLAYIAHEQGDYAAAHAFLKEGEAIYREQEDTWGLATVLNNLARIPMDQGNHAEARPLLEESLALRRRAEDAHGIAMSLTNLGIVARELGDLTTAMTLFEESLAIRRQLADQLGITFSLNSLAAIATQQGEYARAAAFLREALAIYRELGNRDALLTTLENVAMLAAAKFDTERAITLFGAADALRADLGAELPFATRQRQEQVLAVLQAQVDAETFARLLAEGAIQPLDAILETAMDDNSEDDLSSESPLS